MTPPVMLATAAVSAAEGSLDTADVRWAQWIEKGRRHDRAMRRRWLDVLALVGALLILGASLAIGLQ